MGTELEMALRLVLAVVLGGVIGFQREWSGKEAGLRTHILICAGAALAIRPELCSIIPMAMRRAAERPAERPGARWGRG